MRKIKYLIPILILFLSIGFATVNSSLSMNGDTLVTSDIDDFNVYFSNSKVNGEIDYTIIESSTELIFNTKLVELGNTYTIEYEITNSSAAFDAEIAINCTNSNDYLKIVNTFDIEKPIKSRGRSTGILTLTKLKTNAGEEKNNPVTCILTATPVERNNEGSGEVQKPLLKLLDIGATITIANETFYVIKDNGTIVTLLAQYALSSEYRQVESAPIIQFSEVAGWEYTPGPKEIDIQKYEGNAKTYVNNYVKYLQEVTGDPTLSGDLITLKELKELGCYVPEDYYYISEEYTCETSPYSSWLILSNNHYYTKSAVENGEDQIWALTRSGKFGSSQFEFLFAFSSIRPVIKIQKNILEQYK